MARADTDCASGPRVEAERTNPASSSQPMAASKRDRLERAFHPSSPNDATARADTGRAPGPRLGPERANPSLSSQPAAASKHNPLEEAFYPPSHDELTEFARSCTVRVDYPKLLDSTPGEVGEAAEAMNATPDEVHAMNEAMRGLHTSFRDRLRGLYAEATGQSADGELSPRAMLGELQDKRPPENAELFQEIARERAGERSPPTDLSQASAYERAERMYLGLGDEFQNRVAQTVGPERASALRAASGGWKWSRSVFSGCDR